MAATVQELAKLYSTLLGAIGVEAKADGSLHQVLDGDEQPFIVKGLQVYLPTNEVVTNYNDSLAVFHPIGESLIKGESPMLQGLRSMAMRYLTFVILNTVDAVLSLAVDNSAVSQLNPSQIEWLKCANGADETTLKNWKSIMRRIDPTTPNRAITIFLKRGAELGDGHKFARIAIVNFNLYNELLERSNQVYGVRVRKSDINVLVNIFEAIFEHINVQDHYSRGSDSNVSPYLLAMIEAVDAVIKPLNKVNWMFRKPFKQLKSYDLHREADFMKEFKNVMQYRDVLPFMPLNDGDDNERRDAQERAAEPIPPAAPPQAYQHPQATVTSHVPPQQQTAPITQPDYNAGAQQDNAVRQQQAVKSAWDNYPTAQQQLSGMGGFAQPGFGAPQQSQVMLPPGYNNFQNTTAMTAPMMPPMVMNSQMMPPMAAPVGMPMGVPMGIPMGMQAPAPGYAPTGMVYGTQPMGGFPAAPGYAPAGHFDFKTM